ncbi:TadE/TadG family type IV pilus assembly protein [Desulfobaculum sp.]
MRQHRERGLAALEVALILPLLAVFIATLVEGGNMLGAYTDIRDCSRQAARLLASSPAPPDVTELVRRLAPELDADKLSAAVTTDDTTDKLTVEVSYVYATLLAAVPGFGQSGARSFTLRARTSMPAL